VVCIPQRGGTKKRPEREAYEKSWEFQEPANAFPRPASRGRISVLFPRSRV